MRGGGKVAGLTDTGRALGEKSLAGCIVHDSQAGGVFECLAVVHTTM